jgi:hypothetical protein
MFAARQPKETSCAGCAACRSRDCPAEGGGDGPVLEGRGLVAASTGLFLGPIVLAVVGAAWFDQSDVARLLGALAGLGVGVAASVAAAAYLRWSRRGSTSAQ